MSYSKKLLLPILVVSCLLVSSLKAYAYTPHGYRFASSYITYSYMSGTSNFNSAVTASASSWSSSTDVTLSNYTSGGQILVTEVSNSAVTWDGITYRSFSSGFYSGATISINKYITSSYSYNKLRSVVAHEFGHALGLEHSSNACVMLSSTPVRFGTYGIYTPQSDDINGINSIY